MGKDGDDTLSKWLLPKQNREDGNVYKQAQVFNNVLFLCKESICQNGRYNRVVNRCQDISCLLFLIASAIECGFDNSYPKGRFDSIIAYLFKDDNLLYMKLNTSGKKKMLDIRNLFVWLYK